MVICRIGKSRTSRKILVFLQVFENVVVSFHFLNKLIDLWLRGRCLKLASVFSRLNGQIVFGIRTISVLSEAKSSF